MEDVARRARVGVGTVYRRFPSKDVLVRRIAEEETSRLTDQARTALGQEEEPWSALSRFLRTSVASGAGRLLPPHVLRVGVSEEEGADEARVPAQRVQPGAGELRLVGEGASLGSGSLGGGSLAGGPLAGGSSGGAAGAGGGGGLAGGALGSGALSGGALSPGGAPVGGSLGGGALAGGAGAGGLSGPGSVPGSVSGSGSGSVVDDSGAAALLEVVGQLVDRARAAGELRPDVSVSDVLLVIATAAPSLPDAAQQAAASARLLDILLEGLRSRPV
ncbi:helix-turn-helix domain-containing protein [Streptomyces sp. NPDC093252]|uniref:TetR/AcrR family transcriptional regulator n=1 Tax=Streptomyces sp. NPDC093252 TaxID=3154980 RepID=UPI003443CF64